MKHYGLAKCSRISNGQRVDVPACIDLPEDAPPEAFVAATEAFAEARGLSLIAWHPWSESQYRRRMEQQDSHLTGCIR